MKMRETITTIAEKSGVSKSTVDRALKNQPGVSPETRELVLRVASECGYRKNIAVSALRRQNSPVVIAVLFRWQLFDEQIKEGLLAAQEEYYDLGVRLRFFDMKQGDYQEQYQILESLKGQDIKGIILKPVDHPEIVKVVNELESLNVPVVAVSSDLPSSKRFRLIGQNYYRAGRVAGELMATALHGKGRVAIFHESTQYHAYTERERGFEAFLQENAKEIQVKEIICADEGSSDNYQLALKYLQENADIEGILCTGISYPVIARAVLDSGNEEVTLIGYDIFEDTQELFEKRAIKFVITQNPFREGYEAVRTLFQYVTTANKGTGSSYFTTLNIVNRESIVDIHKHELFKI